MDFWRTEYDEEDFEPPNYVKRGRKAGHLLGRGAPHIPNKQEAKELRRLMQKSGESEEQVRVDILPALSLTAARSRGKGRGFPLQDGHVRPQPLSRPYSQQA